MGLKLRDKEKEIFQANLHWSSYIVWGTWALFGLVGTLGVLLTENTSTQPKVEIISFQFVIFFLPLALKLLKNKCKTYAVTDQRLYIEEGILAKTKVDIPFQKINDIQMNQGIIQRILGSGNIMVFSGNSIPVIIKDIDNPNEFKEHLFNTTQKIEGTVA